MSYSTIKRGGSSSFLMGAVLFAIVFLAIGLLIPTDQNPVLRGVATIFVQLSGAAIAAAITTLFVGFKDVRDALAGAVASLLSSGEAIELLSKESKEALDDALQMDKMGGNVHDLDQGLWLHLKKNNNDFLSCFHWAGFRYNVTLSTHPDNDDWLIRRSNMAYRVMALHLRGVSKFNFHSSVEITASSGMSIDDYEEEFEYKARVGPVMCDKSDVEWEYVESGHVPLIRRTISVEVDVEDFIDVEVSEVSLASASDPTEIIFARYPTEGFSAQLTFEHDYDYDSAWMRAAPWGKTEEIFQRGSRQDLGNGIIASTNDWVLPGEGVILYWFK